MEYRICKHCDKELPLIGNFEIHKIDYDNDITYYRYICKECQKHINKDKVSIQVEMKKWNAVLEKEILPEIPRKTLKSLKKIGKSRVLGLRGKYIKLLHRDEIFVQIGSRNLDYYISNYGRLLSHKNKEYRIIEGHINVNGYLVYKLSNGDELIDVGAHQLVAQTFFIYPNKDKEYHVHHKDRNKLNNDYRNLQYVTPREHNILHYIKKIGIYDRTTETVSEYDCIYDIAEFLGISIEQFCDIIHPDNETAEKNGWRRYIYYRKRGNVYIAAQTNNSCKGES